MDMPVNQDMTPEVKRGVIAWILKAIFGLLFFAVILFLAAGRFDWVWGWMFIGLLALASVVNVLILIPTNPALLAERSKGLREENAPKWDKVITGIAAGLLPVISWIVAALDVRFGWSSMSLTLHLIGAVGFVAGWGFVLWATYANSFFTTTVRVQDEHTVQTGGPYQFVRHPGYVGAILYQLATPFLLGSWWALIPMILSVPLFFFRTAREDATLHDELSGYPEYAQDTPYRLIPGIW